MYRLIECTNRMNSYRNISLRSTMCPLIFDSWTCFNATEAGQYQLESCPQFPHLGFDHNRKVKKYCDLNGEWWVHPDSNKSWTNYSSCLDQEDAKFHFSVNRMTLVFLWISLVCLLLSVTIFLSFPSIKCLRIRIHIQMFCSLALNNISWIFWYHLVLFQPSVLTENDVWCRFLHVLTTYFMMSTYSWMLCEATFLRMILVNTFSDEDRHGRTLFFVGWLFPVVVLLPYILYRVHYENIHCWMDIGSSVLILAIPVILVFAINIVFLCNVIKIIHSKLQFQSNFGGSSTGALIILLRSTKAVFILIPIFGLQFLLLPIRPKKGDSLEYIFQIVSSLSTSTQGIAVSILLCFTNHEIIKKLRISFRVFKAKLEMIPKMVHRSKAVRSRYGSRNTKNETVEENTLQNTTKESKMKETLV